MKIEVISFTGNSGLADYAVSLSRSLAKTDDICLVSSNVLPEQFDRMGFAVDRVFRRSRHYPVDVFRFLARLIKRKPKWAIFQGPLKYPALDAVAVRLLRLLGINTAITVHDVLPHYPRKWSRAEYSFYYKSFDKVIAHSEAARSSLRVMGIANDILVVPHGVYDLFDLTAISRTAARRKLEAFDKDDCVVLFFGHLEPRKGFMEFLEMAYRAKDQCNIKFLIAGGNDLKKHGQQFIDKLEKARQLPNVLVHDWRISFEDVETYFSAVDVVVLPYLEGSTSGVLKLAIAFGKPVIATRVGDLPEEMPAGGGELVSPEGDIPSQCLDALDKIQKNYDTYAQAVRSARSRADWGEIANRVRAHLCLK